MNTQEKIKVMQAFVDGEDIEWSQPGDSRWRSLLERDPWWILDGHPDGHSAWSSQDRAIEVASRYHPSVTPKIIHVREVDE